MDLFAEIIQKIKESPFVGSVEQDLEMRVASLSCSSGVDNIDLLNPLVEAGLIPDHVKINGFKKKKLPVETRESNGSPVWRGLLILRNHDVVTLALSADRGKI